MQVITSAQNEIYKSALSLRQRKHRYKQRAFLLEGHKMIEHAFQVGMSVQWIFINESVSLDIHQWSEQAKACGTKQIVLSSSLFKELCDTVTPQGAVAVVAFPELNTSLEPSGIYIALDRIQDPGNLGTIIRTADAAGFTGIILSEGTVDPFNEKVLRATMGSIFSMPIIQCDQLLTYLKEAQEASFKIYATALKNSVSYATVSYEDSSIIVIGNEGQGVLEDIQNMADAIIKIPIYGSAESLNASVAAAVVMYEAARQRHSYETGCSCM